MEVKESLVFEWSALVVTVEVVGMVRFDRFEPPKGWYFLLETVSFGKGRRVLYMEMAIGDERTNRW